MNSKKNGSLLIIGCGWVGKKLGELTAAKGRNVFGTTRSSSNFSELSDLEIKPVKLELPGRSISDIRLPEAETVVISISPGRGNDRTNYPKILSQLAQVLAERNAQIIMYSSTSVYGNEEGMVTEENVSPDPKSNNAIVAAEGELRQHIPEAVILRLSGLYGEDRHPAKYMAGRTDISDGDAPVNLVHRDDVIQVTQNIIEKDVRREIFNVCSELHPTRAEIYTTVASRLGLKEPAFQEGGAGGKTVSSKKLMDHFNIEFLHPDPKEYLAD